MKQHLSHLVAAAVHALQQAQELPADCDIKIQIERTRNPEHGDFACNIAMALAKQAKCNPRELADKIIQALPASEHVEKIDIAGPGFMNFHVHHAAQFAVVEEVLAAGQAYGRSQVGNGQKVIVEFVSANPTGPLHVGHGRGAAYGAAVSDLLEAAGFDVHREYYVNDAGRQMDILATSVWLRYLEACGHAHPFPSNGYRGDYIKEIAQALKAEHGEAFDHALRAILPTLPADEVEEGSGEGDKEAHIDALIQTAKKLLGEQDYRKILDKTLESILSDIRDDLGEFGVHYQNWFSERSLRETGAVQHAIDMLKKNDCVFEEAGALWFRATDFGDEKDRVLVRANGDPTYFGVDVAYHLNKVERGFSTLLDVMGADHHGYMPRVQGSLQAAGVPKDLLKPLLVQFAVLYRGKERVQMSTRSGEFVTLRELREEVGSDAARFFYVLRKHEQHMDFDLELAKSQSNDNPLYYIQYAHARICSVQQQLQQKDLTWDKEAGLANLDKLVEAHETELMSHLSHYPELLESAAIRYEPHVVAHFLQTLAQSFHTYYNAHTFIIEDSALRNARLSLIMAVKQVLANGLTLLGVNAPESM